MANLPPNPSLDHLRKQAKRLVKSAQAGEPEAVRKIGPFFGDPVKISLQQAQLVLARGYGFSSWTGLKRHIEAGAGADEVPEQRAHRFLDLVCIHYGPETDTRSAAEFEQAAALLKAHPEIASYSLHTAAAAGDVDALRRQLEAAPHLVDEKGGPFQWTPLMYAAYARLPGISTLAAGRLLLAHGADPNAHYMSNGTYRFAVLTGVFGDGEGGLVRQPPHPEMEPFARALLDQGANPNDSQGAYNRCFSRDNAHLELMLEYGLKDSDPSDWWQADPGHNPADHRTMHFQLIIALRWGFAERARLLIEHGVDIDTPDTNYYPTYTNGYTPYQVALMRGLPEIAALIKSKGGKAEPLGEREAFEAACMRGDLEAARTLAPGQMGGEPERDQELLREAAGNGMLAAVEAMIALGFELSPPGTRTPLHAAAYQGHFDVVKALVAGGADTAMRDPDYHTPPFVHALHAFKEDVAAYLMRCPMDIFSAAAMGREDQLAEALAENAALADARFRTVRTSGQAQHERDWATPLWFAAVNGRLETARLLLSHGARADLADDSGKTIRDYAEEAGQSAMVEVLKGG